MIIKNGLVFTESNRFEPVTIFTSEDLITDISTPAATTGSSGEIFDATGCYVIPGLTDIHFHGCSGHDFCEGTLESLDSIAAFELNNGTTSICPATMSLPAETLSAVCQNAAEYRKMQECGKYGEGTADLVGIHLEGPFINTRKQGAQNEAYIQSPSSRLLHKWQNDSEGLIRLVSLAPEMPEALSCINECKEEFRFSIAHTEADYDTALKAFHAGADHVTHLYNAMPPLHHREPGVVGAAFDTENVFVELICDGVHIAPGVVRATFRLFGDDRVVLISDSMEATGMSDGCYSLGGLDVNVNGNRATLPDGTIAGSVSTLYQCMLSAVSMGVPLESAIKAATINPCRSIGIDARYGSIREGKKAHFLILGKEDLSIKAIIKGQCCY